MAADAARSRAGSAVSERANPPAMLDQASLPWFAELNASLRRPCADSREFQARVRGCVAQLRTLAAQIRDEAQRAHPQLQDAALDALLGQNMPATPVDRAPAAIVW